MKESRVYNFKNKVFELSDIKKIARTFTAEKDKHTSSNGSFFLEFEIKYEDGVSIESESLTIFDEEDKISSKKTSQIKFSASYYGDDELKFINLDISEKYEYGFLKVKGDDDDWVISIFNRLVEIINDVKTHENFIINHKKLIKLVLALPIGFTLTEITNFLLNAIIGSPEPQNNAKVFREFLLNNPTIHYIFLILITWISGLMLSLVIVEYFLLRFWPNIEFDFGPEHHLKYRNRRKKLWLFFSIVFVPLFLQLIFYII